MLKRFLSYYRPVKTLLIKDMMCSFFIAIIALTYPIITRLFMQDFIPNGNQTGMLIGIFVLFILFTIRFRLTHFVQYQGHMMGVRMQGQMRKEVFMHLEKLPFSYFDNNQTGKIMSRVVNDLQEISELAHHGPEDVFVSTVSLVGAFAYLMTINVTITLIVFAFIPVLVIFAMRMRKKLSDTTMATRVKLASVNAGLESSISGIRVTKAFAAEAYEEAKFEHYNEANITVRNEMYNAMANFFSGTGYIIDLLLLITLATAGLFTLNNLATSDDLVTYLLFFSTFIDPIRRLINFIEQFQAGSTGFERFCELMDEKTEWEKPSATDIDSVEGAVCFENVAFAYDEESEVFQNISLSIAAGETAAFVGPSGGGKTTLCHLLPRFYDLTGGRITLDGKDITDIRRQSLRDKIGIVQQDTFLFGGSIRDNIRYGSFDSSEEEIISAAKRANIHDFIMTLPNGYETEVGERGTKLSGGQKQRVAIARVLLKDPPILILDEATSALDNTTEVLIQQALEELSKGRTTLVVAHRLSTIRDADKIFVITGSGVAEEGSHDELIINNGIYAELYNAQFKA